MANAMVALATTTLGSTASTITFGSIPATYRDLRVVINGTVSGVGGLRYRLNGDTGGNYSYVEMRGNKSGGTDAARSTSGSSQTSVIASESNMNTSSAFDAYFECLDYSATDKHKSNLSRTNYTDDAANTVVEQTASRWASTSAVTSVTVFMSASTFAVGTTLSLYGIVSA